MPDLGDAPEPPPWRFGPRVQGTMRKTPAAPRLHRVLFGCLAASGFGSAPEPLVAQSVAGVVVDATSRQPLNAAVVDLVDSTGAHVRRYLVGRDGRFRFEAPRAGEYFLHAERLGASSVTLGPYLLEEGAAPFIRLSLDVRPIALDGLDVSGLSRCGAPAEGDSAMQAVWEEARKGLTVAALSDSLGTYTYELVRRVRQLDPRTLVTRQETSSRRYTSASNPITSAPLDDLLHSGFVETGADGYTFFAPDARVLLSDEFLDSHCFTLVESAVDDSTVGLAYRPIERRGSFTDVEGILWLSTSQGHPVSLEFDFTNLPSTLGDAPSDHVGGEISFHHNADGTVIVDEWVIRMPEVRTEYDATGYTRTELVALTEEGGYVATARRRDTNRLTFAASFGSLSGRVAPPPTGAGARVLVRGLGVEAPVQEDGTFRIEGLAEGRYELAYLRPELLGLDGHRTVGRFSMEPDVETSVVIEPASSTEVLRSLCSLERWERETGVLVGEVIDRALATATGGVEVVATWQEVEYLSSVTGTIRGQNRQAVTTTDAQGQFRLCGIPQDVRLSITLSDAENVSQPMSLALPLGKLVWRVMLSFPDA